MAMSTTNQVGILIVALLLAFVFVYLIYYIYQMKKKRTGGADHIQLYFDEHFRNIIDEWDLMPRSKVKTWKKDMNKKLKVISRDIGTIKKKKTSVNSRMDALEKGMKSLEEF
ncbi:MAG: hypothetical protein QF682_03220 [Candidatus Thermoplasmatota archaeon]|jgi:hypothetical protein|nr:hypothetical protein [Candidatus Thermoplasmatota archaeon]